MRRPLLTVAYAGEPSDNRYGTYRGTGCTAYFQRQTNQDKLIAPIASEVFQVQVFQHVHTILAEKVIVYRIWVSLYGRWQLLDSGRVGANHDDRAVFDEVLGGIACEAGAPGRLVPIRVRPDTHGAGSYYNRRIGFDWTKLGGSNLRQLRPAHACACRR